MFESRKRYMAAHFVEGTARLIRVNLAPQFGSVSRAHYPGGWQIISNIDLLRELAVRILHLTGAGPYEEALRLILNRPDIPKARPRNT
jgi:hypothetical protein